MSVTYDVVLNRNKWKVKCCFTSKMHVKQQNCRKGIFLFLLAGL